MRFDDDICFASVKFDGSLSVSSVLKERDLEDPWESDMMANSHVVGEREVHCGGENTRFTVRLYSPVGHT